MFGQDGDYPITDDEWKKWKQWDADPNDPNLEGWKPDGDDVSDGMKKYYAYRNRGVDDFLLRNGHDAGDKTTTRAPNLANLGRIATPAGAPALPDSRTWLLVGIDAEQQVGGRHVQGHAREYRASAAGGWDTTFTPNLIWHSHKKSNQATRSGRRIGTRCWTTSGRTRCSLAAV